MDILLVMAGEMGIGKWGGIGQWGTETGMAHDEGHGNEVATAGQKGNSK